MWIMIKGEDKEIEKMKILVKEKNIQVEVFDSPPKIEREFKKMKQQEKIEQNTMFVEDTLLEWFVLAGVEPKNDVKVKLTRVKEKYDDYWGLKDIIVQDKELENQLLAGLGVSNLKFQSISSLGRLQLDVLEVENEYIVSKEKVEKSVKASHAGAIIGETKMDFSVMLRQIGDILKGNYFSYVHSEGENYIIEFQNRTNCKNQDRPILMRIEKHTGRVELFGMNPIRKSVSKKIMEVVEEQIKTNKLKHLFQIN